MSSKLATAFLDRVQRSGLVSESEMPPLREDLQAGGVDLEDARAIADALVQREALTRWQADKLLQGKHKGFFLGSYRLLRPLGKGGMGAVFQARHEMMRRQCAIKVLPHTLAKDGSSGLERFYVEAQAVAALDHQNIVRAYDVNKELKDNKEIHYLVMEYVEGQDVQATVNDSGPLDCVRTADYLRQTANGLAHAHENGLVHRDIKPANLLVDSKGVVKILDLGLARFHDDSGRASLTTAHNETVLGTADYLSPEQALNSHDVDHRTDIYSLGCTAYFMLTGHPPFPDGTVAQRLVAHQVKRPKPISDERSDVPADLVAIVDKMMAKDADERYPAAADVALDLSRWLLEYGGEEWKRQHSEITGDSAIMRALSQREPTRAMSLPGSETELELAPLDEDEEKPASEKAAGSGVAVAGSADEEISLALDDEPTAAGSVAEKPTAPSDAAPAVDSPDLQEPVVDLEGEAELPSLDEAAMLESLDSLESQDLLDVADIDEPLGAIQSDLQLPTIAGPQSSTSHRRLAPQPASRSPIESIKSVGLPIAIGAGGGLLLVVVIILLLMFGSSDEPGPSSQRPAEPAKGLAVQAPGRSTSQPAEKPAAQPTRPVAEPAHTDSAGHTGKEKPSDEPAQSESKTSAPTASDKEGSSKARRKQGKNRSQKRGEGKRGSTAPASTPAPPQARSKPPEEPDAAPVAQGNTAKPAPPEPKPATAPPPTEQQLRSMFAGITEMSLELPAASGGDRKPGRKPDPQAVLNYNLRRLVQSKFADVAERLGIKLTDTEDAVLRVTGELKQEGQYLVVDMSAVVDCRAGDANRYAVWQHQEPIVRVRPGARTNVEAVMKKGIDDFFKAFQRDYRTARP